MRGRVVACVLLFALIGWAHPAQALPSYARQTGQPCASCHTGFPELTLFGRLFKLNGYTLEGGKQSDWPAIAMMLVPNLTHTATDQPEAPAPHFGPNDNFAFTGSLFYGGKIPGADHLGAFVQVTYDQVPNQIHWDNLDFRYANATADDKLVYGISLNNNPTLTDPWNTLPAWGYPYISSQLAPSAPAATLIESGLAQQVLGVTPYFYWNNLVYGEIGGYRTLGPGGLKALGVSPNGASSIEGIAPYWRLAIEPQWGHSTWEFGTFGLEARLNPDRDNTQGADQITDVGIDSEYQWLGDRDFFSVQGRFIKEFQDLPASQALGLATNGHNEMRSFSLKGSYYYKQLVGVTTGFSLIRGSADPLLFGGVSANNKPDTDAITVELDYLPFAHGGPSFWPWFNMKLGLQYTHFIKFAGSSTNFDGTGRNASNNDTLFAFVWLAF